MHLFPLPVLAAVSLLASAAPASASPQAEQAAAESCIGDGLIHAEVSRAVTRHVASLVAPADGAKLRDAARLTLPCGWRLDTQWVQAPILTDGTQQRQYLENNPFGFAVPLGFGKPVTRSYTMQSLATPYRLKLKDCAEQLGREGAAALPCSAFTSSIFATEADPAGGSRLFWHRREGAAWQRMREAAQIRAEVAMLSFIPVPDAPMGMVALYLRDGGHLYRVFLDVEFG